MEKISDVLGKATKIYIIGYMLIFLQKSAEKMIRLPFFSPYSYTPKCLM